MLKETRPTDHHKSDTHNPSPNKVFLKSLLQATLVVLAVLCILYTAKFVCVLFAGLLLGVALYRTSNAVRRWTGVPYTVSFFLCVFVICAIVGGGIAALVPFVSEQATGLTDSLNEAANSVVKYLDKNGVVDSLPKPDLSTISKTDAAAVLGGVFSSASTAVTGIILVVFTGFFLAFEPDMYKRGFLQLIPPRRRERAHEVLDTCLNTLWWWIVGRIFAMTVVGIAVWISLWIIGIPFAVVLGLLAGLFSFVPAIGAVLAIVPALLIAIQQGWETAMYVLIAYLVIQAVENNLLTPIVQREAVELPPVLMLASQVLMGILVGAIGVAIATPAAALALVFVRETYVHNLSQHETHPST